MAISASAPAALRDLLRKCLIVGAVKLNFNTFKKIPSISNIYHEISEEEANEIDRLIRRG